MRDVVLVSSQFPSGVSWLLNFLLEVNIAIYRINDLERTWNIDIKNNAYSLSKRDEILQLWLPILQRKKVFHFEEPLSIYWHHELPNDNNRGKKIILFVRDGRDAVYSQYKRECADKMSFSNMLQSCSGQLNLSYAETWALHGFLWSEMTDSDNLLIVRFEDIKNDPLPVVKNILHFLNIKRSDHQVLAAVEASGFEKAKEAEAIFRKNNVISTYVANRKGAVNEWKETYSEKELHFFSGFAEEILLRFGYQSLAGVNESKITQVSGNTKKQYIRGEMVKIKKTIEKELHSPISDIAQVSLLGRKIVSLTWVKIIYHTVITPQDYLAAKLFDNLFAITEKMLAKVDIYCFIIRAYMAAGEHIKARAVYDYSFRRFSVDQEKLQEAIKPEKTKSVKLKIKWYGYVLHDWIKQSVKSNRLFFSVFNALRLWIYQENRFFSIRLPRKLGSGNKKFSHQKFCSDEERPL